MPRPGPRPYECVRRAWHSERHKPMRGSLIQEIFRVVSEIHSSATKRNKEWQEKLPIVVLKAEEIMYSNANSEAEYMDLTTLWDRANDAINTIIRVDDSAETGDLLRPCIEAALHLGCIPRKASRSQRHNDPRRYLSPNPHEPLSCCHSHLKNSITSPHCMAMYSNIFTKCALSNQDANVDNSPFKNSPLHFLPETSSSRSMAPETCIASVIGHSVYQLYHWGDDPQLLGNSLSVTKISTKDMNSPKMCEDARFSILPQTTPTLTCDLSLRLGPSLGVEEYDKYCHNPEFRDTKSKKLVSTELQLFPNGDDAKYLQMDKPGQKRKAPTLARIPHPAEEMIFLLQPKLHRENPE